MMEGWKKSLRDYLIFSRSERNGILILCALILAVAFLPRWIDFNRHSGTKEWQELVMALESDTVQLAERPIRRFAQDNAKSNGTWNSEGSLPANRPKTVQRFAFDPNTADLEELLQLGLNKKVAATLIRYRQAGGRFRQKSDLRRIYGITNEDYAALEPYIRIGSETPEEPASDSSVRQTSPNPAHPVLSTVVELNAADSALLVDLPGIGPVLARRIINWRSRLGGFYAVEQLLEVRGLTKETLEQVRPWVTVDSQAIQPLNVNLASEEQLKSHPYFRRIATLLVSYRQHHGPYRSFGDLEQMEGILPEELARIRPYLIF
ncbi:MAG: helix-hairpin-helix domain-containing protein [Chitinophagales bacterium]|nr:helix-hairpin-helix domain-containing protein [Chitinophagales bacterium]MDW8393489.1 helix-hairpin-helix domain-containing protein [Chitinophagales bacterium]